VLLISGMVIATAFTKFASIVLFSTTGMPPWLTRWLKYIPTGVFTAIITPAILMPHGQLDLSFENYYFLAGLVTIILAWRYRSFILTVVAGSLVMLCLAGLIPRG
jgi:branched-subunit amino acid transport protein